MSESKRGSLAAMANLINKIKESEGGRPAVVNESSPKASFQARKEAWEVAGKANPIDLSGPSTNF